MSSGACGSRAGMRSTSRPWPCTVIWKVPFVRAVFFVMAASSGFIDFLLPVASGSFCGYSFCLHPASNLQDIVSYREKSGGSVRCSRCGNENPETNRFCGMCGASLLPAPAAVASTGGQSAAAQPSPIPLPQSPAPVRPDNSPSPRTSAPVSEDAPVISGPSFLGLNQPAPRKRASLSTDPHPTPSSRSLDYLLEDEEEPRRGGGGKFVLILLALALAVGLGYLRWKNQGFGWLSSGANKPSAAQSSDATDTSSTAMPTPSGSSAPATPATGQPATDAAQSAASPAAASPTTNPATGTTPASTAPAPADATPSPSAANSPSDSTAAPPVPVAKDPTTAADTPPASPKPDKAVDTPKPKPPAAVQPVKTDPVSEAQKFIYGRGVKQDCDRGLRILKPAAAQANPRAMIEMGALYSAGLCTPRDLPTAYRWFALALRKDPDNQAVQTDLQKLWGEMTQPERQLAIRMSQ